MKKIILISLLFFHVFFVVLNHLQSLKSFNKGNINLTTWGRKTMNLMNNLNKDNKLADSFFQNALPITSFIGTDNGYGLFAPQIPFNVKMNIKAYNIEGKELIYPELFGQQSQRKLNNAIDNFRDSSVFNDFIMRSIATRHFELIPESTRLDIFLTLEEIPLLDSCKNWNKESPHLNDLATYSFQLKN
jgi:hypothetical protein